MNENFIQAQYDVSKKSKIKEFYESKKYLIYSLTFVLIIALGSVIFYLENKEKKKFLLSENYLESKILRKKNEK